MNFGRNRNRFFFFFCTIVQHLCKDFVSMLNVRNTVYLFVWFLRLTFLIKEWRNENYCCLFSHLRIRLNMRMNCSIVIRFLLIILIVENLIQLRINQYRSFHLIREKNKKKKKTVNIYNVKRENRKLQTFVIILKNRNGKKKNMKDFKEFSTNLMKVLQKTHDCASFS